MLADGKTVVDLFAEDLVELAVVVHLGCGLLHQHGYALLIQLLVLDVLVYHLSQRGQFVQKHLKLLVQELVHRSPVICIVQVLSLASLVFAFLFVDGLHKGVKLRFEL